jgi:hypothetical protein
MQNERPDPHDPAKRAMTIEKTLRNAGFGAEMKQE